MISSLSPSSVIPGPISIYLYATPIFLAVEPFSFIDVALFVTFEGHHCSSHLFLDLHLAPVKRCESSYGFLYDFIIVLCTIDFQICCLKGTFERASRRSIPIRICVFRYFIGRFVSRPFHCLTATACLNLFAHD